MQQEGLQWVRSGAPPANQLRSFAHLRKKMEKGKLRSDKGSKERQASRHGGR